jgi:hypothetical protein
MRRTSFAGALAVIAVGGALAFGIQATPKSLDIHLTGMIIMLAGIADLALRFLIADSPLFSRSTAEVAAVLEPVGEPVLDVFGNPITPTVVASSPPLTVPVMQSTQILPVYVDAPAQAAPEVVAEQRESAVREYPGDDQFVRQVGDHGLDESLVPVSPLTGRPVRTRRRGRRLR